MNKTFLLSTILVFTLLILHCALFKNLGKEFYETGELHYEYKFVGRRRNGVAKEYYKTGELKGEWVYKNGMLLDTGKGYYRTGELQYKYKYENGKLNGVTKQYYRTGELKSEWIYEDGMLLDTGKGYYRTGELRFKHKYENGKLNGITKEYYRTGELWAEWEYKNGKHVSGCKEYYKNGELKPKQRTVKEINEGLLDTTKIDTTIWHTEYNKFLSKLDLTLRSREKIDSIITFNEQYILNTLNKYDLKIKEIDTLSFSFYGNGKLWIPVLNYTKDSDTIIGNAVNRAIAEVTLDSIPSEEYIASGQLLFTGKKLTLLGSVKYGKTVGRSRASIMRVVMNHLAKMRYAYNKRLRSKPGIKGRITVKYAIDQYGRVIFAKMLSSTMDDELLQQAVVQQIRHWKHKFIFKDGDITEVVYPFVFSQ